MSQENPNKITKNSLKVQVSKKRKVSADSGVGSGSSDENNNDSEFELKIVPPVNKRAKKTEPDEAEQVFWEESKTQVNFKEQLNRLEEEQNDEIVDKRDSFVSVVSITEISEPDSPLTPNVVCLQHQMLKEYYPPWIYDEEVLGIKKPKLLDENGDQIYLGNYCYSNNERLVMYMDKIMSIQEIQAEYEREGIKKSLYEIQKEYDPLENDSDDDTGGEVIWTRKEEFDTYNSTPQSGDYTELKKEDSAYEWSEEYNTPPNAALTQTQESVNDVATQIQASPQETLENIVEVMG